MEGLIFGILRYSKNYTGRVGDGRGEANNRKGNSSACTFYNDLRSDKTAFTTKNRLNQKTKYLKEQGNIIM